MVNKVSLHRNAALHVICIVCGKEFVAQRVTAKFCSGKCRQTAKRDRDAIGQRVYTIEWMIDEIARTDSSKKLAALARVKNKVDYTILKLNRQ